MLKQGTQTEVVADVGMGSHLPPLNNLPQWSRINTLDKARYPKPFLKDRLQPLPGTQTESGATNSAGNRTESLESQDGSSDGVVIGVGSSTEMNPYQRIQHLEKSISFLQVQHQEVLVNLHDEIEKYKRENKDLQFRIIMLQKNSPPDTASLSRSISDRGQETEKPLREKSDPIKEKAEKMQHSTASASSIHTKGEDLADMTTLDGQSAGTESKLDELKVIFLEEEIKELKRQLKEEKSRNNYLAHLLQQAEKQKLQTQQQNLLDDQSQSGQHLPTAGAAPGGSMPHHGGAEGSVTTSRHITSSQLPFNASMVPLQVRLPHKAPRPPTLAECEVIIRHLQSLNDKQAHELNQLKTDLRDVLYSHKWTPDAYLLAKAYVAEDDAKELAEKDRLPRIPLKQQARKLPDVAYIQRDTVTLPALKQTMGNKAIERRKRTQTMQKSRVRREVLP